MNVEFVVVTTHLVLIVLEIQMAVLQKIIVVLVIVMIPMIVHRIVLVSGVALL